MGERGHCKLHRKLLQEFPGRLSTFPKSRAWKSGALLTCLLGIFWDLAENLASNSAYPAGVHISIVKAALCSSSALFFSLIDSPPPTSILSLFWFSLSLLLLEFFTFISSSYFYFTSFPLRFLFIFPLFCFSGFLCHFLLICDFSYAASSHLYMFVYRHFLFIFYFTPIFHSSRRYLCSIVRSVCFSFPLILLDF